MVDVGYIAAYRQTCSPSQLAWSEGRRSPGANLHSSAEPGELSKWLGFGLVLKRSLSAHWMQVKLFCPFNLNSGLHEVSVGKPSVWMSNFWTVLIRFRYFISESELNFEYLHIPTRCTGLKQMEMESQEATVLAHPGSPGTMAIKLICVTNTLCTQFAKYLIWQHTQNRQKTVFLTACQTELWFCRNTVVSMLRTSWNSCNQVHIISSIFNAAHLE